MFWIETLKVLQDYYKWHKIANFRVILAIFVTICLVSIVVYRVPLHFVTNSRKRAKINGKNFVESNQLILEKIFPVNLKWNSVFEIMAENSWEPIFQTFLETDQTRKLIETALKNFFEYKIHGRTNEKSDRLIDTCSINVDGVLFYSKCLAITPRLERSPEEVLKRCDELLNNFKCNFQSQFPKQDLPLMR